jgi:hypothetical protein
MTGVWKRVLQTDSGVSSLGELGPSTLRVSLDVPARVTPCFKELSWQSDLI